MLVVLGQRPLTKGFVRLPSNYYWAAAFVLGLSALVLVIAGTSLFLATDSGAQSTAFQPSAAASSALLKASTAASGSLDSDVNNDGQVDGIADSLVASGRPPRGQLDNDLDNDGNPDGMADSLVGLGLVSLLIPSVGGSLVLLSLYELPLVGCDYYLPLERPG